MQDDAQRAIQLLEAESPTAQQILKGGEPETAHRKADDVMTGDDMRDARGRLGRMWGFGRPLHMSEMARACRLTGNKPSDVVRDYERGKTRISGPLSALIECYLKGGLPPDGLDFVRCGDGEGEED